MWNLKNKISEQTKLKQTHGDREQTDHNQWVGVLGNGVKKVKGLQSKDWQLQNSRGR